MALTCSGNHVLVRHRLDGRWSWVVLFCAMVCQTINLGIMKSFGVLFPVLIERLDSSRERTAWIGSLAIALILFAGPLAAALTDRFGCRLITVVGGLLCALGLLLASFAVKMIHYYLTYSLLYGLGGCFIRTSCFLIMAKYFYKRRALATGILSSAAGLGMFVSGPFTQQLLNALGLDDTYRVLAGLNLVICISALVFHPNVEAEDAEEFCEVAIKEEVIRPRNAKLSLDCSVWKVPAFVVMVITFTVGVLGVLVPPQHLVKYCQELGFSPNKASNLFIFIGIASFISRIAAGRLCDVTWVNPRYVYQIGTCMNGVILCLIAVARSYAVFVVLSILFGIAEGMNMAVLNLILLNVVEARRRASAMGLANALMSVSVVGGSPLTGLIADQMGSYEPAFFTIGSLVIFASSLPFILLCLKATDASITQRDEPIEMMSPRTAGKSTQSVVTEQNTRKTGVKEYWFVTSV